MKEKREKSGISRRTFIKGVGGGLAGTVAVSSTLAASRAEQVGPQGSKVLGPGKVSIALTVNGKKHVLDVEPRTTLLDALRDHLGYTGTKRVCNRGECGACTVILDGQAVLACSIFAVDADGAKVETIEGLGSGGKLHPLQEAFVKHDALQCGFCTPGFIMSSLALLRENPSPSMDEIQEGVSGNLCRCGTYPNIFSAVQEAAETMKKGG